MAISDLSERYEPSIVKGPPCTVCGLLANLDDTEAAALNKLLADPLWRYSNLSAALATEGHKVPAPTLARHARGLCANGKKMR